jgi:hypothetical protein
MVGCTFAIRMLMGYPSGPATANATRRCRILASRKRPHLYVRAVGALSCEAVCGATGERVLATPVSRRPLE